jgi:hypothetical protein
MNPSDVVENLRRYYAPYHDHKETMAYSATTVYIAATTAVILHGHTLLDGVHPQWIRPILLTLAFAAAHGFIIWQLVNRHVAATILHAASVVILDISPPNAVQPNMSLSRWRGQPLPRVVTDQIANRIPRRLLGGAPTSAFITVSATLAWSALAIVVLCK